MANCWSRSSMSLVSSVAASESVRATTSVGVPETSAARRAAFSVRTCWLVGTSTLPPMWPHFFSEASWSSRWTRGRTGCDEGLRQLVHVERASEAGLGVGDDRQHVVGCRRCLRPTRSRRPLASALLIRFTRLGPELAG